MKETRSSQHTCGFVRCGLMPTSPGIRQTTMGLIPSVYLVVMYGDPILSYITSRSDWYWVSSIQPPIECHVLSISSCCQGHRLYILINCLFMGGSSQIAFSSSHNTLIAMLSVNLIANKYKNVINTLC